MPLVALSASSLAGVVARPAWRRRGRAASPRRAAARPAAARLAARFDPEAATGLALTLALVRAPRRRARARRPGLRGAQRPTRSALDARRGGLGRRHATPFDARRARGASRRSASPASIVGAGGGRSRSSRRSGTRSRWVVPVPAASSSAATRLITTTIKHLVDRVRPTLNPIAETLGPSFPSGHSSSSAAFFAAARAAARPRPRPPRAHRARRAPPPGIAVAVAASRVLLDVHWLERRRRRPRARLGVVRGLRDRVRRAAAAVRRGGQARRAATCASTASTRRWASSPSGTSSLISTWRTCASTVRSLRNRRLAIAGVRQALGHQLEHLALARRSARRADRRRAGRAARDDLRVERRAAAATRSRGVEELADVEHAVLEQVAEAAERRRARPRGVVSMCWESTSTPTLGVRVLDLARRAGALVGVRRRHADVEHDEVGPLAGDGGRAARRRRPATATTSWPPSANSRARPSRSSTWSSAITTRMAAPRPGWCRRPRALSMRSVPAVGGHAVARPASPEPVRRARRPRRRRRRGRRGCRCGAARSSDDAAAPARA